MVPNHYVSISHRRALSWLDEARPSVPPSDYVCLQAVCVLVEGPVFPVSSVHDDHFPSGTNVVETSQLRSDTHFCTFLVHFP